MVMKSKAPGLSHTHKHERLHPWATPVRISGNLWQEKPPRAEHEPPTIEPVPCTGPAARPSRGLVEATPGASTPGDHYGRRRLTGTTVRPYGEIRLTARCMLLLKSAPSSTNAKLASNPNCTPREHRENTKKRKDDGTTATARFQQVARIYQKYSASSSRAARSSASRAADVAVVAGAHRNKSSHMARWSPWQRSPSRYMSAKDTVTTPRSPAACCIRCP